MVSLTLTTQIESLFNNVKTKLQEIYDRHDLPYPNHSFQLSSQAGQLSLSLSDFQRVTSTIGEGFRQHLNTRIIGEVGKVKSHQYILKTDGPIEINERDSFEKDWFGRDKKVIQYGYWIDLDEIEQKFATACLDCCDYTFEDEFVQSCLSELIRMFTGELETEVRGHQQG